MVDHKPLYILDASVVNKWGIELEDNVDLACLIRDDFIKDKICLCVPEHVFFEVMNTIGRKFPDNALRFLSQILTLKMEEHGVSLELAGLALDIMAKFPKVSFYDAVYHALAMKIGGTFVTADEKYYEITKSLRNIMLLKDYSYD